MGPMTYMRGPLFHKLLPKHGLQRLSNDLLQRKLLNHSLTSEINSHGGTPCREWQRAERGGYGRLWNGQRLQDAHVISFEINVGPIPDGHHVLHRCDNPACWEPSHLWTGTVADNMADRDRKGHNGSHKLKGAKRGPSPQRGAKHALAKLTVSTARRIHALAKAPVDKVPDRLLHGFGDKRRLNVSALARELEVSDSLVRGVIDGRNWTWLVSEA